jgi:hypothetical protein
VITSDYHIPRAEEILSKLIGGQQHKDSLNDIQAVVEYIKKIGINIGFVSAEEILLLRDPRYNRIIREARATDAYKERMKAERHGMEDLKEDKYKI